MIDVLIYPGIAFIFFMSLLYTGIMRKLAARMQNRIGPPILQPFWDVIKLFGKESFEPEQVKYGFTFWPAIALTSSVLAGLLTPIAGMVALELTGDIIVILYLLAFGALAVYISGFVSSNPYAVVGSIRGIIQLVSHEFPLIASVLVPVIYLLTLSPMEVNNYQLLNGSFLYVFPFATVAYFVSMLAEAEIPPFHTPRAHQEIVSGYSTEYTGFRLAMLEMTHMVKLFVLIALFIAFFLGGSADLLGFLWKSLAVLMLVIFSRVGLARFRINGVLKFCWTFGLIALIDLVRVLLI
jgi:NADH-quinone oxidoreductase subunit H